MKLIRRSLAVLATLAVTAPAVAAQSFPGANPAEQAAFGRSVAVMGDLVLVGEPTTNIRPGTIYVYGEGPDGAWREIDRLTAPEGQPEDGFGQAMAVDGDHLIVGASGAAHLFHRQDTEWHHMGTLTSSSVMENDAFGASVAISQDVALVGAPRRNSQAGAVHVFRLTDGAWVEADALEMEGTPQNTGFGASLALRGGTALIGAPGANERRGSVAVYRVGMGTEMVTMLEPGQVSGTDQFGTSVAFDGDRAVVGAPAFAQGLGIAHVFSVDADGEWTQTGTLLPYDGSPGVGFGVSVALASDAVWVGAPAPRSSGTGAAYRFALGMEGDIADVERVAPEDGSGFAGAMAISDEVAAFGMPGADYGAGQAAIFQADMDAWTMAGRVLSEVESYDPVVGGQVDCESGSASAWDCSDVDLVSFLPIQEMGGPRGVRMNDVWGWTDPETGKEYVLAGMMNQTSFVDISDPANPVYVGRLPMTPGARANAWRDVKVYDDHAYIVADGAGQHGMQVFDLTRLRDFDGEPETYEPDALYENIASAHNIVINEEAGMAFAVGSSSGGETCGGGLHMIDIRDPKSPTFAGCFADPQTGRASTGYSHDAQCVTYDGPDEAYQGNEICFGANETALSIADVSDKANPVALSRAAYPNVGYSHQGWLTDDHRYFYMNDELDELQGKVQGTRTLIWDVSDLEDPQLIGEHFGTTESSDHNLYILGDRMYQSNYQSGLQILDISDPANPVQVGFFDTVPYGTNTPGFGGSWSNYPYFESGVVVVTSGNEGLFILKPSDERTISE